MMGGKMKGGLPDVVLVRKSYPNARKRSKGRNWKLRSMAKTEDLEGRTKTEKMNAEKDMELFLRDVEEDAELRGMMNLFKAEAATHAAASEGEDDDDEMMNSEEEPEEDFPEISMDELLEDMGDMNIDDDEATEEQP